MTRCLFFLLLLIVHSGCIYSYYDYRLKSDDDDPYRLPDPRKLMNGQISVDYKQYGIFPRGEGFLKLDPAQRLFTLITLPVAICVELPWRRVAKKQVRYQIQHPSMVAGLNPVFFECPVVLNSGDWRDRLELRWKSPGGGLTRIVLAEKVGEVDQTKGEGRFKSKLRIYDDAGVREIDLTTREAVLMSHSIMTTFDGNTIYMFDRYNSARYLNYLWRTGGGLTDIALVKFDMKSGVFTKMIWFEGWNIHVTDDVMLDKSTLKICSGWLGCHFDDEKK